MRENAAETDSYPSVQFSLHVPSFLTTRGRLDLEGVSCNLAWFESHMVSLCCTSPKYTHFEKALKSLSSRGLCLRPIPVLQCSHTSKLPNTNLLLESILQYGCSTT